MESLPLEVVEMVVCYISGQDLAACCAASHSWRNKFNRDTFWKHLCKQETAVYLSRTPCCVEPAFISPEVEGSELEPVCQWRMNFMRENHLLNNWRSGRYLIHKIPIETSPYRLSTDLFTGYPKNILIYREEFLITVDRTGNEVEIWDLRFDPEIYVHEPCRLLQMWSVNYLFLCGNSLVVVQRLIVLVFQINLMQKTWPLQNIFFIFEDESTDFTSASFAMQDTGCHSSLVGNYLLANSIDSRSLHIWDVVNGLKLKEETLDNEDCLSYDIKPSTTSLDDIIVYQDKPGTFSYEKVMVYSLINLTFYPCVFQDVGYCDLHKDKIVVKMEMPFDHLLIANYKTGEQIHRIKGLNWSNLHFCQIFGNKLIFKTNRCINQINLSTGEIKKEYPEYPARLEQPTIIGYQLLGDKFIFLKLCNGDGRINLFSDRPKDIWEIRDSKRLVKVSNAMLHSTYVLTNTTLTKMIVKSNQYGIRNLRTDVISFW